MQVAVDAVEKERKAEGEEEAPAAAAASSADADADAVVEAKTELDAEATESASTMRQAVEDKVLSFVNSAMVVLTIKKILAVLSAGELVEWHLGGEMLVVVCAKMGFLLVS